jgi:hypothetical protein
MHETLSSFPEQFGDSPRKSEIKPEILKETEKIADSLTCGWFWFRPVYLQRFRTAKWALFWLCWAGAMQGTYMCVCASWIFRANRTRDSSVNVHPRETVFWTSLSLHARACRHVHLCADMRQYVHTHGGIRNYFLVEICIFAIK